ncbi:hypothetical protein RND71_028341 [Anisodus tanguticus]|uniref:DUF7705 domain-containing protein n=1 Tax=Anisodus tanguticus TaxID=243964 RepID=A0AAE1V1H9_9SOLA|nr:hypothetical protein RND71_028341 [Anisodus tanguticus]
MIIVMGWFSSSLVFSLVLHICDLGYAASLIQDSYVSAIGDPGMKNPNARFAFEAWNFCNEVGSEAPHMGSIWGAPGLLTVLIFMGSPRLADCADLHCSPSITVSMHCLLGKCVFRHLHARNSAANGATMELSEEKQLLLFAAQRNQWCDL